MNNTIIENSEEITLNQTQFERVSGIVYYCDECKFYHIKPEFDMNMVETLAIVD